jgi:hypothetical protein
MKGASEGTVGSLEWIHVLFLTNYNKIPNKKEGVVGETMGFTTKN